MSEGHNQFFAPPRIVLCSVLCCLVLGLIAYSNSLHVPFYLDDLRHITQNQKFLKADFSWSSLVRATLNSPSANRPEANISFAVNLLLHKERLASYHLVNIAIHILTAVLFFLLSLETLNLPALQLKFANQYTISLPWPALFSGSFIHCRVSPSPTLSSA